MKTIGVLLLLLMITFASCSSSKYVVVDATMEVKDGKVKFSNKSQPVPLKDTLADVKLIYKRN